MAVLAISGKLGEVSNVNHNRNLHIPIKMRVQPTSYVHEIQILGFFFDILPKKGLKKDLVEIFQKLFSCDSIHSNDEFSLKLVLLQNEGFTNFLR